MLLFHIFELHVVVSYILIFMFHVVGNFDFDFYYAKINKDKNNFRAFRFTFRLIRMKTSVHTPYLYTGRFVRSRFSEIR